MAKEEYISFLRENELFQRLNEEELKELLPFIKLRLFREGEWIFQEGSQGREFFIVKKGKAEVLKEEKEYRHLHNLGILVPGDHFGEMAHLEGERRSASVRAVEAVEILSLDLDALRDSAKEEKVYLRIISFLARKVSQNLRKTDETLIESLKERLRFMQAYAQVSKTLIFIFVLMAIWFNLSKVLELFREQKAFLDPIFTSVLLILFALPTAYVMKTSHYPLSFYGLTLKNWLRNTLEAALYSAVFLALAMLLKWVLILKIDSLKNFPLIGFSHIKENFHTIFILGAAYIFLVPVQEFIARGLLQSCFRNFFQGPNSLFLAILSSNLIFQMLHTVKDFWLALASFFFGLFWGVLFEKQKSLVGVCVSHAMIGAGAFFFLDYQAIFESADPKETLSVISAWVERIALERF